MSFLSQQYLFAAVGFFVLLRRGMFKTFFCGNWTGFESNTLFYFNSIEKNYWNLLKYHSVNRGA